MGILRCISDSVNFFVCASEDSSDSVDLSFVLTLRLHVICLDMDVWVLVPASSLMFLCMIPYVWL